MDMGWPGFCRLFTKLMPSIRRVMEIKVAQNGVNWTMRCGGSQKKFVLFEPVEEIWCGDPYKVMYSFIDGRLIRDQRAMTERGLDLVVVRTVQDNEMTVEIQAEGFYGKRIFKRI